LAIFILKKAYSLTIAYRTIFSSLAVDAGLTTKALPLSTFGGLFDLASFNVYDETTANGFPPPSFFFSADLWLFKLIVLEFKVIDPLIAL
jgi:hypothetical protein